MQPILVLTCAVEALAEVNGRPAGEVGPGRALTLPVTPWGAVALSLRPLEDGWGDISRRFTLSGGAPVADSLVGAEGLFCVAWPGGVLEAELLPPRLGAARFVPASGHGVLLGGPAPLIGLDGRWAEVPRDALPPRSTPLPGGALLLGERLGGGRYALWLPEDRGLPETLVVADALSLLPDGALEATIGATGAPGPTQREIWRWDGPRLSLAAREALPAPPPRSIEERLLAALAALSGGQPTDRLIRADAAVLEALRRAAGACELCLPLAFPADAVQSAVGLLHLENAHLATVRPLRYAAEPAPDGPPVIREVSF